MQNKDKDGSDKPSWKDYAFDVSQLERKKM